jgi:hypothetical protein
MASSIDATKPIEGSPQTQNVRDNFSAAKDEIEALQALQVSIAETEGFVRKTGSATYEAIKSNLSATVAPTVNEDSDDGYAIGSTWIDVTADKAYVALDVTVAAAVWTETTASSSGDMLSTNNLSDVADAGTSRSNLGVAIGSDVQAFDAGLTDVAGLAVTDGNFIVGDGANWVVESGATARTSMGAEAADPDILKADTADVLTAGFATTPDDDGTKTTGTYTPDEATGNFKHIINGGAFTLGEPTNKSTIIIYIVNDGSAGAITTTAWDIVTGDTLTTTDTEEFLAYLTIHTNGSVNKSHLHITALQ